MKKTNFVLIAVLAIISLAVIILSKKGSEIPAAPEKDAPAAAIKEPPEAEKEEMKVNFYLIDREKAAKGAFVGSAELKAGKLIIEVTDPKLKELLEKPYTTMAGEVKDGVARDWMVTYQPGTVEHLRAIGIECWQWGYLGELDKPPSR